MCDCYCQAISIRKHHFGAESLKLSKFWQRRYLLNLHPHLKDATESSWMVMDRKSWEQKMWWQCNHDAACLWWLCFYLCVLYHVTNFLPANICFYSFIFFLRREQVLVWNKSLSVNFTRRERKIGKKMYYVDLNETTGVRKGWLLSIHIQTSDVLK